jgi:hypothetical protein
MRDFTQEMTDKLEEQTGEEEQEMEQVQRVVSKRKVRKQIPTDEEIERLMLSLHTSRAEASKLLDKRT